MKVHREVLQAASLESLLYDFQGCALSATNSTFLPSATRVAIRFVIV